MKSFSHRHFLVTILTLLVIGCSVNDEPEIEVILDYYQVPNNSVRVARVNVQSLVDETTIHEVIINRGNCVNYDKAKTAKTGRTLKYGEILKSLTSCNLDNIREVEVTTEKNIYTVTFD
ncbi:hypothetical protein [Cellvibrio sp. PSBB006]|uniref:hypothetical protein n=1 Tax=Cellvibrio sp. PSBB006 TaxID=1987723 RepID=UPI000B3B735F|nr:hypothetical protein [Cellvibrio sp. PSBB006]ARU26083.1 hypothetical protein CBR65_00780 [Cellvibrio sp. PSBB006]